MAAVITLQSPSATGPAAPSFQQHSPHSPDHRRCLPRSQHPQQQRHNPAEQSTPLSPVSSNLTAASRTPGRDGSSCDACLRRKSRCAMNEMVSKCYSCEFHRQECTFTLSLSSRNSADLQLKKRKLDDAASEDGESVKRYVLHFSFSIRR